MGFFHEPWKLQPKLKNDQCSRCLSLNPSTAMPASDSAEHIAAILGVERMNEARVVAVNMRIFTMACTTVVDQRSTLETLSTGQAQSVQGNKNSTGALVEKGKTFRDIRTTWL